MYCGLVICQPIQEVSTAMDTCWKPPPIFAAGMQDGEWTPPDRCTVYGQQKYVVGCSAYMALYAPCEAPSSGSSPSSAHPQSSVPRNKQRLQHPQAPEPSQEAYNQSPRHATSHGIRRQARYVCIPTAHALHGKFDWGMNAWMRGLTTTLYSVHVHM